MGLLSSFLNKRKTKEYANDSYSAEIAKCLVTHKLKKDEYDLFSGLYYQGYTSYRDFFKYVFGNNTSQMKKIVNKASKMAEKGCNIDFTFVRFMKDDKNYVDIPFDVFTDKRNMKMSKRNTKLWNRANIKRLLVNDPNLRNMDDDLLKESIKKFREDNNF